MPLPPLLQDHISQLISKGYKIEVCGETEYCIVFKDYPIPEHIWNRNKVDLLILAHPTYPNSKLDMFWVNPPIALKDGRTPNAGGNIEEHCGKTWQRFSWHASVWNPSFDNLISYLEFVNARFYKAE